MSCATGGEAHRMKAMRMKARVVGNTLVVEDGVSLPEGAEVEVDVVLHVPEGVEVDEETASELELAHQEADAGDFVSEEEVWADIEARRRA